MCCAAVSASSVRGVLPRLLSLGLPLVPWWGGSGKGMGTVRGLEESLGYFGLLGVGSQAAGRIRFLASVCVRKEQRELGMVEPDVVRL